MSLTLTVSFKVGSFTGSTSGVSLAKMLSNIKARALARQCGYPIGTPKFNAAYSEFDPGFIAVALDPRDLQRKDELYRLAYQGLASKEELALLKDYQTFTKDIQTHANSNQSVHAKAAAY